METLADTVCLRMSGFGFCVVYVIDGQIQLVIVLFNFAAVFGANQFPIAIEGVAGHTYDLVGPGYVAEFLSQIQQTCFDC